MVAMCIFNRLASLRSAKFGLYLINVTMPKPLFTAAPAPWLVCAPLLPADIDKTEDDGNRQENQGPDGGAAATDAMGQRW